ncbi:triose-phosphate isomerase [Lentisphaerota bacterium WC36G]|nr:triose-phosphate isomerase [Lentisphaerae bacterium WC36]
MSRTVFIAGNWKMNKTAAEAKAMIEELKPLVAGLKDVEIGIAPTFTSIGAAVEAAKGSNIKIGSQNIHWAENGAFTGEISADMLKEAGVQFVIIGHSERRQYFGETDETVNSRTKACLAANLQAVVCIGETLEEREGDKTETVLETQLKGGLAGLSNEDMADVVIAYEPVWAIGTGKTATKEMAQDTQAFCRKVLTDMFGVETAQTVRIQYGGSMNAGNSAELVAQEDIDGGLIGGASLSADTFVELIKNAIS